MNAHHLHHRAFSRIEALGLCSIALLSGAALLPALAQTNPFDFFGNARENARASTCQSNLKRIGLSMLMYLQDYDERFPPIATSKKAPKVIESSDTKLLFKSDKDDDKRGFGWAGLIQPYLKSTDVLQCPDEKHPAAANPDTSEAGYTDYWMNARASGQSQAIFDNFNFTVLSGDGDGGSPASTARYAISDIPASWRTVAGSPAKRHLGRGNYLFADGHVKAVALEKIGTAPFRKNFDYSEHYTFSPQ